ncbi:HGWP repeat containing protein-like [Oryza sativa Japonica Group]|uniref:HGWP repeat containing protein-like n=2 Tax=Oryza sativa subsp. japonica TaxID=39947 RepID=Q5JKP0_ORYSJ|nr:HGWP repeat containing protein-like [Oryza sativa Japonica Group]BAD87263.1 HGWP repeat containing protein-like [Oryza sativa Japonica Group]BAD87967.1 HGWP repeat containing protein-like [Oryza sativa Japonica Group]
MVAGGDHRGAGAPLPSAVPARPPSGAPSRLPSGPGRQPPAPAGEADAWDPRRRPPPAACSRANEGYTSCGPVVEMSYGRGLVPCC